MGSIAYYDVLPVHPSPKRLESLTGYLTRLAEVNGITSVDAIVSVCFPNQNRRVARVQADFPPLSLASLVAVTACPEPTLLLTTFQPIGKKFGRLPHPQPLSRFLAGSLAWHLRFCPACLAEDPYYRLTWRFLIISDCPVHHCRLLDRCGHCQSTIPLLTAPLKLGICPSCHVQLSICQSGRLTETHLQIAQAREDDITFLLLTWLEELGVKSVVEMIGAQFAKLRRVRRRTAEEVAQKIGITLSSIEGIERGQAAKGATLACYFRCADELNVTLRDVFTMALAGGEGVQQQIAGAQGSIAQQTLEQALDAVLFQAVYQAIQHLETERLQITQQAIGELVQMTPQGLKRYPSVRVVLEQLAEHNRSHQQCKAGLQLEQLMQRVRAAAIQLRARGEPVTQRAISRALQIPWSSLRTHEAIKAVLREVAGSQTG